MFPHMGGYSIRNINRDFTNQRRFYRQSTHLTHIGVSPTLMPRRDGWENHSLHEFRKSHFGTSIHFWFRHFFGKSFSSQKRIFAKSHQNSIFWKIFIKNHTSILGAPKKASEIPLVSLDKQSQVFLVQSAAGALGARVHP